MENNNQPRPAKKKVPTWLIVVGVLVLLSVISSIIGDNNSNERQESTNDNAAKVEEQAKEDVKVDSAAIARLQGRFRIETDEFTDLAWVHHKDEPKYRNLNAVYAYFEMKDGKPTNPRFVIQYEGADWLFIQDCIVMSDMGKFSATGNFERDNSSRVWEWLDLHMSPSELQILDTVARGENLKIRCNGRQYHKDRNISKKEQNLIKETIDYYYALGGK